MGTAVITLKNALKIMQLKDRENKPFPFDMTYRTFNSQSKQGGKLKTYTGAKFLPDANPNNFEKDTVFNILDPVKEKRKPSHFENRTRNIEVALNDIKKIRIDFIISINNQYVIY